MFPVIVVENGLFKKISILRISSYEQYIQVFVWRRCCLGNSAFVPYFEEVFIIPRYCLSFPHKNTRSTDQRTSAAVLSPKS